MSSSSRKVLVTLGDVEYEVLVTAGEAPDTFTVLLDGKSHSVVGKRHAGGWQLLVGDRPFWVDLERDKKGQLLVGVGGATVKGDVADPVRKRLAGVALRGKSDGGPVSVTAPMPGKIVKVLVQVGATVAADQGLVVVEAMKMENELRAPRAGKVLELRAREGQPVESGETLVVLT